MSIQSTDPHLVTRIMANGGKILVVGGESKDLPNNIINHPAIIIWDDNKQEFAQKTIPSNTRIIIWNRWISHASVGRLNEACKSLHAIKFPFLRAREIKELLSEMVNQSPSVRSDNEFEPVSDEEIDKVNQVNEITFSAQEQIVKTESTTIPDRNEVDMAKTKKTGKRVNLKEFIAKHIKMGVNYSVRGSVAPETRRLFEIAKKEGIKPTLGSLSQAMYVALGEIKKNKTKSQSINVGKEETVKIKTNVMSGKEHTKSEFEEFEKLIADAIAAMKLVQEYMPKIRKEVSMLRSAKDKVLAMFGGD